MTELQRKGIMTRGEALDALRLAPSTAATKRAISMFLKMDDRDYSRSSELYSNRVKEIIKEAQPKETS